MSNNAINLLRTQYKESLNWLEGTLDGVTGEVAHYVPSGNVTPIAGHIAHIITGLDFLVLGSAASQAPLATSSFAGKIGMSELPPQGDSSQWMRTVKIEGDAIREYGKAVFAAVDEYLATLSDDDLAREIDLPFGKYSVGWVFNIMLLNTFSHTGEISAIKGLQGLKGYPM